ncbi:hypothetical protein [Streptomyces sp. NPDC088270]|uniref:hypothetical protein n=1 Tax=unclassified Streptomyces TaxID=2593676 RepID=UPI003422C13D
MSTEHRLTTPELVEELRSSLDATNGWIPAFSDPEAPADLPDDAGLAEVVSALQKFAAAVPAPAACHLKRAAESADSALAGDDDSTYGHLGVAYAHVLQAQRAASKDRP